MNKKTDSETSKWQDNALTAITETLEILADKKLIMDLKRGITEIATGKGIEWETAKQDILA